MILATVGTQLPFPRLIQALDEIAPYLNTQVVAQIGKDDRPPKNIEWQRSFEPSEFQDMFLRAHIIVSHAGMGTILAAKKHRKPIVIMPRMSRLGEHRNDHQIATANQMKSHSGVHIAFDAATLHSLLTAGRLSTPEEGGGGRLEELKSYLRGKVNLLLGPV